MRIVPSQFKSLDYQVAANFNGERFIPRITQLFGLLRLTLASVDAYGITAYSAPHERNRSTDGPRREPRQRSLLGSEQSPPAGCDHPGAEPLEGESGVLFTRKM
jgi:hypothetical protein